MASQTFAAPPQAAPPMSGPPAASPASPGAARPVPPPMPPSFGAPPVKLGGFAPAPAPAPVLVRPRRRTGPWIVLVIVLALIGSCLWGGAKVFGWIGEQFKSVTDGFPGATSTDDSGNLENARVDGLTAGTPIDLGSGGKITAVAGSGTVFTAVVSSGKVDVQAFETAGKKRWGAEVPMEPEDVTLRVVGSLLIVDGVRDTQRGGANARSVIDVGEGGIKWTEKWDHRIDLFYLGTDAITEIRDGDTAVQRTDLLTGKARWSHKGKGGFITSGDRLVHPVLGWPGAKPSGAIVPSYELTFQGDIPFQESLDADPGVVVQMQTEGKAATVDLATGNVRASGTVASAGDLPWLAYAGLAIFKKKDVDNAIVAYRLQDFSQAWEYKTTAGVDIEDLRPCGDKLVCVKANQSQYTLVAVGTDDGKAKWTKPLKEEPNWYVLDGKLVLGGGAFTAVEDPVVSDTANGNDKYALGTGLSAKNAYAGTGNRVAMVTIRVTGTDSVWQVAIVNLADGKVVGAADYSKDDILTDVSLSADTVVLIDEKNRRIHRYAIPGPK
jgi:hypothetical protein